LIALQLGFIGVQHGLAFHKHGFDFNRVPVQARGRKHTRAN
jgi:hypothetical protein